MIECRWHRAWFPDQQVEPGRILAALKTRRAAALPDPAALPWMAVHDIGIALGLIVLPEAMARFHAPALIDPCRMNRRLPGANRWVNPIARRDVEAALRHYETTGEVIRLPHPLARWAAYMAPLNSADAKDAYEAWGRMDRARENARHEQRVRRIALGQALTEEGR